MEKHKEVFFTIRLHSAQSAASLSPIQDPDPLMQVSGEKVGSDQICSLGLNIYLLLIIQVDLMDGRDAFLTMARDRHLEFSSLRRCKYSSLAMLYELHTQAMVISILKKLQIFFSVISLKNKCKINRISK